MFGTSWARRGSIRSRAGRGLVGIAATFVIGSGYACAPAATWRSRPEPDVISEQDLTGSHFHNAYEAVEALHANWFETRANSFLAQGQVLVYMDNIRLGGISELQNIPVSMIDYVQHYDAVEATTRWGLDHTQGVIYVSTHPR